MRILVIKIMVNKTLTPTPTWKLKMKKINKKFYHKINKKITIQN